MRTMNITSPGVVHRHLQKLADWDWVDKDSYGRYFVKKKVGFKGYLWIGSHLIPMSVLFAIGFVGLSIVWVTVLMLHVVLQSPIDQSYAILTVVTIIASVFLLIEALRPGKRTLRQPVAT